MEEGNLLVGNYYIIQELLDFLFQNQNCSFLETQNKFDFFINQNNQTLNFLVKAKQRHYFTKIINNSINSDYYDVYFLEMEK